MCQHCYHSHSGKQYLSCISLYSILLYWHCSAVDLVRSHHSPDDTCCYRNTNKNICHPRQTPVRYFYLIFTSVLVSFLRYNNIPVVLVERYSSVGCRGPEGSRTGGVVPLSAGGAAYPHRGGGQTHRVPSAGGVAGAWRHLRELTVRQTRVILLFSDQVGSHKLSRHKGAVHGSHNYAIQIQR